MGSSSSSRSLGHISARASCRRMRQPPEKLLTGLLSSLTFEAQAQDQRLGLRARVVRRQRRAGGVAWAMRHSRRWPRRRPLPALRGLKQRYRLRPRNRWRLRRFRACPAPPGPCAIGAGWYSPLSSCSVAVEQGEQGRLARAVAAHQADFFAGVQGDAGAVQQHLDAAAQGVLYVFR